MRIFVIFTRFSTALMEEKPKCSHDVDSSTNVVTHQPKREDHSGALKGKTTPPEKQTLAVNSPTVLTKEHLANLDDQLTVPKIQAVLKLDETIYSIDELALLKGHSKEELVHPKYQSAAYSKSQNDFTEDQSATCSKNQWAHSKSQNALTIEQLAVHLKEENIEARGIFERPTKVGLSNMPAAVLNTQNVVTRDEPAVIKDETSLSGTHIALRRIQSSTLEEQTATSTILNDSAKSQSCSSKELTTINEIHTDSTKEESTSSRELLNIQIASTKDETSFKRNVTTEASSTKNRSAVPVTATPKNLMEALVENYSKKFQSGISLCAARGSATPSCNLNSDYLNSYAPSLIRASTQSSITSPPVSQLPLTTSVAVPSQPTTLFLQALSKLNESSLTLAVINRLKLQSSSNLNKVIKIESGEITPPDSLSSAPPTYSFVLRQLAVRRRPRFMGTFFPSPSFVQHAPPPTYTGAFDVYIEPALPPAPARVYTFGFTSMPIVCPECGYTGMTVISSHTTICTHLCAFILCLLCCWLCAPLPYILRSCKDVYHYCRNCRSFLGMYCPTNPDSVAYPNVP